MKDVNLKKMATAGVLCAVAVVGSLFSMPVLGSRCAPVQHMVNILCAVLLGPGYGLAVAFGASLIRNMLGLGTLMAFPGSMFGAWLASEAYRRSGHFEAALLGEVFGTALLGGLCAYPLAVLLMGKNAGELAFYAYIIPFGISTLGGALVAAVLLVALSACGVLRKLKSQFQNN